MANPQVEHGYTKISNEILEALGGIRIPGEAMQILHVIIRKSYGFKKKEAEISLKEFRKITGIKDKANIIRGLKKLQVMNLVTIVKKDNDCSLSYSLQKNYDAWEPLSKKTTLLSKKTTNVVKKDNDFDVNNEVQSGYGFENLSKTEESGSKNNDEALSKKTMNVVKKDNGRCQKRQRVLYKRNSLKETLKKDINTTPISNPNKGNVGTGKRLYLSFVYLSDEEYEKLCEAAGEEAVKRKIRDLDDYIAIKGVKYKDHYRVIFVWCRREWEKKRAEEEAERARKMREAF